MGAVNEPGADAWEAIADGWAERVRTGTDETRVRVLDRAHLAALGDVAGKRILDAGCGEGRFARMLAERGAEVTGLDLSSRMIAHARAAEAEQPLGIEYIEASMAEMPALESGSFDVVVAYLSILDVLEFEEAYAEIARVLKPGGQFSWSTVHPAFVLPVAEWEPRNPGTVPILNRDKLYLKVDNYFPSRQVRFKMWPTAPTETINYHRTITDYTAALRRAGLLIREISEPLPSAEDLEQREYLRHSVRAPAMMLFDCVKP
jgi:2-polyprenyl-3-methyl-5-hydroxy-6-metoxy-1,4-benzoquinol methylase